jgi:hypothetical protein
LDGDSHELVAILVDDVRQILLAASFPIATCTGSETYSAYEIRLLLTAMDPNKHGKPVRIRRSPNIQYEAILVTILVRRISSIRTLRAYWSIFFGRDDFASVDRWRMRCLPTKFT